MVQTLGSTEIYDVQTDSWSAGPALPGGTTLALHDTTQLANGDLWVNGGAVGTVGLFSAVAGTQRFSRATGFTATTPLPDTRQAHTTTLTAAGLLVIGGADDSNPSIATSSATMWTTN